MCKLNMFQMKSQVFNNVRSLGYVSRNHTEVESSPRQRGLKPGSSQPISGALAADTRRSLVDKRAAST